MNSVFNLFFIIYPFPFQKYYQYEFLFIPVYSWTVYWNLYLKVILATIKPFWHEKMESYTDLARSRDCITANYREYNIWSAVYTTYFHDTLRQRKNDSDSYA